MLTINGRIRLQRQWWHGAQIGSIAPADEILNRSGATITRLDLWPEEADIGKPVILPGGDAGILLSWWNAADGSEWRWQVEYYNHR